ncbi:CBS domain-containing protein [Roseomonas populi]|uniref:CBS domain-containing protein n=1 Tax=Roseomonas populi TaxID=3121582 RepID=A0ABT1WYU1_9PROT|nr:CBS domain-containing protein [Roseomonas pecuniae]MCR0980701.1 CBS domain-containing protein [Roseomonas pecuniae]
MTIASILRNKGREVVSVEPGQSLPEVASTLVQHRIGAVLVRGENGLPAGILSERDIVRLFAENNGAINGLTAADGMTKILHTVTPETPITRALEMITDRRVRHLPVLDGDQVIGIVSIGDLVKARIDAAVGEAEALKEYVTTS